MGNPQHLHVRAGRRPSPAARGQHEDSAEELEACPRSAPMSVFGSSARGSFAGTFEEDVKD